MPRSRETCLQRTIKAISSVLASGKACYFWAIEQEALVHDSVQNPRFSYLEIGD